MTKEFKPFQTVLDIVNGKGAEANGFPDMPMPPGYFVMGEIPLEIRELGSQVLTSMNSAKKIIENVVNSSLSSEECSNQSRIFTSMANLGEVMRCLFIEAAHSILPKGNRWYGEFLVFRNWIYAAPGNEAILLPDIKSPGGMLADTFYGIFLRICRGQQVYDDTLTFEAALADMSTVGSIESAAGKQFYLMNLKFKKAVRAHNPYATTEALSFAFKDAPFAEYLKWRHDYFRLQRIVGLLEQLVGLCILETLGWEKIREPNNFPPQREGINVTYDFVIRGDWKIIRIG